MQTFIAWTPPQQEWTLANKLRAVADDVVMPLEWKRVYPDGKKRTSKGVYATCEPLYRRYLFLKFKSPTPPLAEIARVHGFRWLASPGSVEPFAMTGVQQLMLTSVTPALPSTFKRLNADGFKQGQKVIVIGGVLDGQELTVEHDSGQRFVETLRELFGTLHKVKVPAAQLRAA